MEKNYNFRKFIDGEIELDVRFLIDVNTVWLNTKAISMLFDRSVSVIGKHVRNILKETIPNKDSVMANFAYTADDGRTYKVDFYNLDIILAVGYRTKSNRINKFNDCELEKDSVIKKFLTTASDGKTYNVDYYNLDMVSSVGYRVNSKSGIEFRGNEYCRLS